MAAGFRATKGGVWRQRPAVRDPFPIVALASAKLDLCRQRIQQHTRGHRGRSGDPLYGVRRTARTRQELLSDRKRRRLEAWSSTIGTGRSRSRGGSTRTSSTPTPTTTVGVAGRN
ncbi:transposase [Rhodococcus aetherivorans]|uniref:transposase n=1 Tax=Rhodococcus aetherivorans TaxID=191292 RepID=UPI0039C6B5DD